MAKSYLSVLFFLLAFLNCISTYKSTANATEEPPNAAIDQISAAWSSGVSISSMRNLRGHALRRPSCVSWGAGRVDCFISSPTSSIMHRTVKDGCQCACQDWEDIGGSAIGEINSVSRKTGYLDVIIISKASMLNVRPLTPDGWGSWIDGGQYSTDTPSCAAIDSKTIACHTRSHNGAAYGFIATEGFSSGGWTKTLDGATSPPSCCSVNASTADCFAFKYDSMLYTTHLSSGKFGSWSAVTGPFKNEKPSTASNKHRADVFVLGLQNDIIQITWNGGWKTPVSLGGTFSTMPECLLTESDHIHCFIVGLGLDLFKNTNDGTDWSGWIPIPGSFMPERPSCVFSAANVISCFLRNIRNEIIELDFDI